LKILHEIVSTIVPCILHALIVDLHTCYYSSTIVIQDLDLEQDFLDYN
jgi:hypothetical protein